MPDPHFPLTHVAAACGTVHMAPHAPQLATLPVVSVSHPSSTARLQSPNPVSHDPTAHAPFEQAGFPWATTHAVPHMPQFVASDAVLTHLPAQQVLPSPQPTP